MNAAKVIKPTKHQTRALAFRGHCNVADLGGRGSGKTMAMQLALIEHVQDPDARPLVLRESWSGLQELTESLYDLATLVFGRGVVLNRNAGTIRLPNGVTITLSNVGDENSYSKLQGRTFSALLADEAGNYSPTGLRFLWRAMSNLRAPEGKPTFVYLTANPRGRSHAAIYRRFVRGRAPWKPFIDEHGEPWVVTTSTLQDNPHIDREAYRRKIAASVDNDGELLKAWLDGDWNIAAGAMFEIDERKHIIDVAEFRPTTDLCQLVAAGDWGTASPATALLIGRLKRPLANLFRAGDLIVFDEEDTAFPDSLSTGSGAPVASWAEQIKSLLDRNGAPRSTLVVTDDARGLNSDTVVNEMRVCGLNATKPFRKDRVGGWTMIRNLLAASRERSDRPGLWLHQRCRNLLQTLPEAPRDTRRPEDLDPRWDEDHWVDALAYGLTYLHGQGQITSGRTVGHY